MFKNSNSNVTKQLDHKDLTTKLSFGLSSISKIHHLYSSTSGIHGIIKHAEAPILAAGFLQGS